MAETLPSAFYRGTRQRNILPSAALGKIKHSANVALPSAMHSAKPGSRQNWALPSAGPEGTRQRWLSKIKIKNFAECLTLALGKISFKKLNFFFCRVPWSGSRQNKFKKNCRVPWAGTRQNMFFKKKICRASGAGTRQNKFLKIKKNLPSAGTVFQWWYQWNY